ncbi:MAG: TraM recognition domain-containing protein, partial [Candidatus Pacebacteria bacterium]|nr:TraM recognition domain-containing protein [Candidatus Paceibacterota bacterium]
MEYILNNCILALLEYPGSTLLGVNRMLADIDYRKEVIEKITDPVIKSFWVNEFARYTQRYEIEATAAIQNKVGQLTSSPLIRNIVGQEKSLIDIREVMDKKKILILNLSKGRIGEDNSKLLGALIVTKIQLAAMSRVDILEEKRQDFFLYVDEFQNFATESFVNILSEARKYRLSLTLGHQYITQMEEEVRDAVFGNIGTLISFRVGAEDSEYLEKEFSLVFTASDIVNLAKYNIYLKLMIDGIAGRAFSAKTFPPVSSLEKSFKEKIIKVSREKYGVPRQIVEGKIAQWVGTLETPRISQTESAKLYDAQCSSCNKFCKVVFQPDGKRPVYCKSCREKQKKAKGKKIENMDNKNNEDNIKSKDDKDNKISLREVSKKEPLPFVSTKEKQIRISKKEIDVKGLREQIKEALSSSSTPSKPQKGIIKPGETVKF